MNFFKNNVISKKVADAIKDAESLLSPGSRMMLEISQKNDFKFNSGSGLSVATALAKIPKEPLPVFTFKPKNPFTKSLGYFDGKAVYLNINTLENMPHAKIVGLLLHEFAHKAGFNHGTGLFANYVTKEKLLYSANYFMSENALRWL